jgi:hypothetical protein
LQQPALSELFGVVRVRSTELVAEALEVVPGGSLIGQGRGTNYTDTFVSRAKDSILILTLNEPIKQDATRGVRHLAKVRAKRQH